MQTHGAGFFPPATSTWGHALRAPSPAPAASEALADSYTSTERVLGEGIAGRPSSPVDGNLPSRPTPPPPGVVLSAKPAEVKLLRDAEQYDCDVVVVGAGMAGLAAAKNLLAKGYRVQVLEAADHKGGRASTDTTDFTVPIDLGGAWLHDVEHNPLTPIIDAMGIPHERTHYFDTLFVNGRKATPEELQQFEAERQEYTRRLEASVARGEDVSAGSLLPPEGRFSKTLGFELGEMDTALPIDKSSSVEVAKFAIGEDDLVQGGLGGFVSRYGQDVPVQLSTPVTRIAHDAGGVTVETAQGRTIRARHTVVTVSTGVLNKGKIAFDPPLPEPTREAFAQLPMGNLEKVIMEFEPGTLEDVQPNTWVVNHEDQPSGPRMDFLLRPLGKPIAVGFVGGDEAPAFVAQPTETCVDYALDKLETLYGPQLEHAFVYGEKTNWAGNGFTHGAYSAALPGASAKREALRTPVNGRIHFAGEETARVEINGSMPGAYEEGVRAANLIDGLLAKDVLRTE